MPQFCEVRFRKLFSRLKIMFELEVSREWTLNSAETHKYLTLCKTIVQNLNLPNIVIKCTNTLAQIRIPSQVILLHSIGRESQSLLPSRDNIECSTTQDVTNTYRD